MSPVGLGKSAAGVAPDALMAHRLGDVHVADAIVKSGISGELVGSFAFPAALRLEQTGCVPRGLGDLLTIARLLGVRLRLEDIGGPALRDVIVENRQAFSGLPAVALLNVRPR